MEDYAADPSKRASSKVLVFAVDDALLGLHLDWVEAVYPHATTERHAVKVGRRIQPFLLHRGEPAFVIEPRALFQLPSAADAIERAGALVLRSGSHLLALGIDVCIGVEELDLKLHPPIPTALTGDGGVPIGQLVDLHGRLVVVLDPNRLVDGAGRDAIARAAREAADYLKREAQMAALWPEICSQATIANLRRYGRLCRRNGRPKTARIARMIGKVFEEPEGANNGNGSAEPSFEGDLTTVLTRVARQRRTGEVAVVGNGDEEHGRVLVSAGCLIDAVSSRSHGVQALGELLSRREARARFVAGEQRAGAVSRFAEITVAAALIEAAALCHGERSVRS
jgi:chemotaxis signal transduction protein